MRNSIAVAAAAAHAAAAAAVAIAISAVAAEIQIFSIFQPARLPPLKLLRQEVLQQRQEVLQQPGAATEEKSNLSPDEKRAPVNSAEKREL